MSNIIHYTNTIKFTEYPVNTKILARLLFQIFRTNFHIPCNIETEFEFGARSGEWKSATCSLAPNAKGVSQVVKREGDTYILCSPLHDVKTPARRLPSLMRNPHNLPTNPIASFLMRFGSSHKFPIYSLFGCMNFIAKYFPIATSRDITL